MGWDERNQRKIMKALAEKKKKKNPTMKMGRGGCLLKQMEKKKRKESVREGVGLSNGAYLNPAGKFL